MSTMPDANLFMFEYWLELAIAAHLTAYGVLDAAKQRDDKNLVTPRVEVKTIWGGFTEHRFTNPTTRASWYDIGKGRLALKCVTRRNDPSMTHVRLVGTVRYLMNIVFATPGYTPGDPNPQALSDHMPFHRIGQMTDTGAVPQFVGNEHQDITALSFDFILQIRQEKFPTT
jgi:hypothetical protein